MTKTEKENLKLKTENRLLKESVEKHMRIYREQLYEIVDMKMKIELIEYVLHDDKEF